MPVLEPNQELGVYTVQSLIKSNAYTETYRVEDVNAHPYFLKLYVLKNNVPQKMLTADGKQVLEIEISKQIKHKNVISYVDSGVYSSEQYGQCPYYLTPYFSGELLVERVRREGRLEEKDAIKIFRAIVDGLGALHNLDLCHNDITPSNILLPSNPDVEPQIIDLGHVSKPCSGVTPFDTADLQEVYCANETFANFYDRRTDIFSACAVLWFMLTGKAPWDIEIKPDMTRGRRQFVVKECRRSTHLEPETITDNEALCQILLGGLELSKSNRISSVEDIITILDPNAIQPGTAPQSTASTSSASSSSSSNRSTNPRRETEHDNEPSEEESEFEVRRGHGNGFADVAGMEDLKQYLDKHVIFAIREKDSLAAYRVTPPNGLLLYGPPGCGKTFIAEKFAEETGFNYIIVKTSDIASSYIHGTQEKIAKLFRKAEKAKPCVICFDEFEALVPDRGARGSEYYAREVNEFLIQLNNCAQKGIFVVGMCNRPDAIDAAVLRTGRIDKQIYVPLPDYEARKGIFQIHLKDRPLADDVDTDKLAKLTEGYVASDIAFIVNDAALVAAYTHQLITQQIIESSLTNTHPSLSPDTIKAYEDLREKMQTQSRTNFKRRIGYV